MCWGLCWMWRDVPFARQRGPVIGVLGVVLVVAAPPWTMTCLCMPPCTALCSGTQGGVPLHGLALEERRGQGSGTQNFVYQKWPDPIFPIVNRFFPRWSLWSGGGGGGQHEAMVWVCVVWCVGVGGWGPRTVVGRSNVSLPTHANPCNDSPPTAHPPGITKMEVVGRLGFEWEEGREGGFEVQGLVDRKRPQTAAVSTVKSAFPAHVLFWPSHHPHMQIKCISGRIPSVESVLLPMTQA